MQTTFDRLREMPFLCCDEPLECECDACWRERSRRIQATARRLIGDAIYADVRFGSVPAPANTNACPETWRPPARAARWAG